jgi:hypothetical protein
LEPSLLCANRPILTCAAKEEKSQTSQTVRRAFDQKLIVYQDPAAIQFMAEHGMYLIVGDANPLEDLRTLADTTHLQFVMKDGRVAACHAANDLPSHVLAKHLLLMG